jgi:hypothetical protein
MRNGETDLVLKYARVLVKGFKDIANLGHLGHLGFRHPKSHFFSKNFEG